MSGESHNEQGEAALLAGDNQGAYNHFLEAFNQTGDPKYLANRARALINLGQLDQANGDIQESLNRNSQLPYAHLAVGELEEHKQNYQGAIGAYERASHLNENSGDQVLERRLDEKMKGLSTLLEESVSQDRTLGTQERGLSGLIMGQVLNSGGSQKSKFSLLSKLFMNKSGGNGAGSQSLGSLGPLVAAVAGSGKSSGGGGGVSSLLSSFSGGGKNQGNGSHGGGQAGGLGNVGDLINGFMGQQGGLQNHGGQGGHGGGGAAGLASMASGFLGGGNKTGGNSYGQQGGQQQHGGQGSGGAAGLASMASGFLSGGNKTGGNSHGQQGGQQQHGGQQQGGNDFSKYASMAQGFLNNNSGGQGGQGKQGGSDFSKYASMAQGFLNKK